MSRTVMCPKCGHAHDVPSFGPGRAFLTTLAIAAGLAVAVALVFVVIAVLAVFATRG